MRKPKCHEIQYIDFLIASPVAVSCCEASRSDPGIRLPAAHDSYTRLLHRLEPDPETLYQEVEPLIHKQNGVLVIDDSTLDKPYSQKIKPVTHHWSGKHHAVVKGINLISMVWTDGDLMMPVDYRIYDMAGDQKTKNDHFQEMLDKAKQRGFMPEAVLFDSWYSSLENLKRVRAHGWIFLTRLKENRKVSTDRSGQKQVSQIELSAEGTTVHLKGFGSIKVFKIVTQDGDIEYWATNDFKMNDLQRLTLAERSWAVEDYHRILKQTCNVERCQLRTSRSQKNHIGLAIRTLVRLTWRFFQTGVSQYELKRSIVRDAVRQYRSKPTFQVGAIA